MPEQTITVKLPEATYRRLQRAAELTYRTVDEVLVSALNAALLPPAEGDLPPDLADELAAMASLNDQALWAAAESSLSTAQRRRLSQLSEAGGERSLSPSESAELTHLLDLYDRSVLRRAQALAILDFRGHEIPNRTDLPDRPHA